MKEDGEFVKKGKNVVVQGVKNGSTKVWEVQKEIEKHLRDGVKPENKVVNYSCDYSKSNKESNQKAKIDLEKFAITLRTRAFVKSKSKCAKFVRIALEAGGANTTGNPEAASDWGPLLIKNGYTEVAQSFDHPQKGDIYIIPRTKVHKWGHIAGYDGTQWISDFKQHSHVIYKDSVSYRYFRIQ